MSYGATLWDQWEQLEILSGKNVATLDRYSEFLKDRAKIDADYAKAVSKLCKSYRDEHSKHGKVNPKVVEVFQASALDKEYLDIIDSTEEIGNYHQNISAEFGTEQRNAVKNQIKELQNSYKGQFDKIRVEIANYKKALDNIEKSKVKYEKAVKDMDNSRKAYEAANQDMNATKKDIEKLRTIAERMATASYEAEGQYKKLIEETNTIKDKHFNEVLPGLLNEVQRIDTQDRIEFTKNSFNKFGETIKGFEPIVATATGRIIENVTNITAESEHEATIAGLKVGEDIPTDFQFQERELDTDPTAKASTRGFTKQASNDDNKEDAIIAIPPGKQGRKKATDRLKVLDKELAEVEKKLQSLANFISIYQAKPDLNADINVQRDLDDQNQALKSRIAQINKRRYKLQVYIASIDGTQPPAPPADLDAAAIAAATTPVAPAVNVLATIPAASKASLASDIQASSAALTSTHSVQAEAQEETEQAEEQAVPEVEEQPEAAEEEETDEVTPEEEAAAQDVPEQPVVPAHQAEDEDESEADLEADLNAEAIGQAKVLYDFEASPESEELSVKAGTVIDVLEKQEDGWWKARINEERIVGYLPGTYVGEL